MKVTAATETNGKILFSAGIVFLMFFLGGCVTPAGQVGVITKCRQAEIAVNTAQQQYNEAMLNFNKNPTNEQAKKLVTVKVESLLEAEENAFQACNRVR